MDLERLGRGDGDPPDNTAIIVCDFTCIVDVPKSTEM